MYCMKLFSSSLTLTSTLSSLSLGASALSHHHQQPRASCLLHPARTPEQLYAIREEPRAAILINIDSISAYPTGRGWNSRYCISTPRANTAHSRYWGSAAAKLTLSPSTLAERTRGAAECRWDARCCYGKYLISSCDKCLFGKWSQWTVKHLTGSVDFFGGTAFLFFLWCQHTSRKWIAVTSGETLFTESAELLPSCGVTRPNETVHHHSSTWTHPVTVGCSPLSPYRYG